MVFPIVWIDDSRKPATPRSRKAGSILLVIDTVEMRVSIYASFHLCVIAVCLMIAPAASAQSSPVEYVEQFAQQLATEGPASAVDQLFATNEWMRGNRDARDNMVHQLSQVLPMVGAYHDKEQLAVTQAGSSLVFYTYLFLYDRQPLRFHFMFYRPADDWMLYNLSFNDSFSGELEEAHKLHLLDLATP